MDSEMMMDAVKRGSRINGCDGVDVYPREDGYYVEHFSLGKEAVIKHQIGPFDSHQQASHYERIYRLEWSR